MLLRRDVPVDTGASHLIVFLMNKILFISLILISSFTLSSCTQTDQVKTKVLDKVVEVQKQVNDKIDQKVTEEKIEDLTDDQLLKQLDTNDTSIDTELKTLETDLQ